MIHPDRWERARKDIDFRDLVEELTGQGARGGNVSCPFHGTDRTPSFRFYPHNNNGFCWGCPPGEQFYDTISFVAKHMACNRVTALRWLESANDLASIADLDGEEKDEDEAEEVQITVEDLSGPFVVQAGEQVQAVCESDGADSALELAEKYIRLYFQAEQDGDPLPLARALEPTKLDAVRRKKIREI